MAGKIKGKPGNTITWLYRFKTKLNDRYIIEAVQHDYDMFIVKFYKKNEKSSLYKYNKVYNDHDARKILGTCIAVANEILKCKPEASFGFLGEPTLKENQKKSPRLDTKRHRIYKHLATSYFSPEGWDHIWIEEISGYLLFNNIKVFKTAKLKSRCTKKLVNLYPDLDNIKLKFPEEEA